MERDVRLDLELRIDAEIDRQLDTNIVVLHERLFNMLWELEVVSHRFVPDGLDIPRGMFDERCVARGFSRGARGVWHRGPPRGVDTRDGTSRVSLAAPGDSRPHRRRQQGAR